MEQRHKDLLISNNVFLVENLDMPELVSHLVQTKLLSINDTQLFAHLTKAEQAQKFLLSMLPTRGPTAFERFMQALMSVENQQFIARQLDLGVPLVGNVPSKPVGPNSPDGWKCKLNSMRGTLVQRLKINLLFMSHMMYGSFLHDDAKENIQEVFDKGDDANKMKAREQLIKIVIDTGYEGFEIFIRALALSCQVDLAQKLDKEIAAKYIVTPSEQEQKLNNARGDLVSNMIVDGLLLSCMMQSSIVDSTKKAEISHVLMLNDRQTAADRLVDCVASKLSEGETTACEELIRALVRTQQLRCAKMLDEEVAEKCLQELRNSDSPYAMSQKHRDMLRSKRLELLKSVHMNEQLLAALISSFTITTSMKDQIMNAASTDDKVGQLIDLLQYCGPKALQNFVQALNDTGQPDPANALME